MVKSLIKIVAAVAFIASLSACGGSGGPTTADPGTPATPASTTKASAYTGSWSGSYAAGTATGTPATLVLTGVDNTNAVTGTFYSARLAGPFTGTMDNTGAVSGTVTNKIDGNGWTVKLAVVNNALNIVSANYGASALGSGSCTATPVLAVDMSGSWIGTVVEVDTSTNVPLTNAVSQVVGVELAYDSKYGRFVGVIVGDHGLSSRIAFQTVSGYWFATLDQSNSWGSLISTPTYGIVYAQSSFASVAEMTQSFADSPKSPLWLQNIILADEYTIQFAGQTVPAGGFKEFKLSLVRPS